jgi:hypothetical protein
MLSFLLVVGFLVASQSRFYLHLFTYSPTITRLALGKVSGSNVTELEGAKEFQTVVRPVSSERTGR